MTETEVLFQELDALFFNSWARPGVDLQPEIWEICHQWKKKQLTQADDGLEKLDAWVQDLLEELQHVLFEEAGSADGVYGEANIWKLQPKIFERWRRIDADVVPLLEADVSEASKKSTFMKAEVKQGPVEDNGHLQQPSDLEKRKVFDDSDSLFNDLTSLFADSWARPGVDLRPEMLDLCETWKQRILRNHGTVSGTNGTMALSKWIQNLVEDLDKVLMEEVGKNGRLLGNADIQRLRPKIFDAWRKENSSAWPIKASPKLKKPAEGLRVPKDRDPRSLERTSELSPDKKPPATSSRSVNVLRVRKRQALPQAGSILMKESRDEAWGNWNFTVIATDMAPWHVIATARHQEFDATRTLLDDQKKQSAELPGSNEAERKLSAFRNWQSFRARRLREGGLLVRSIRRSPAQVRYVMSDADMTLLQMSKSSDYVEMSQEEFADGLKCAENQDSFFQTGGNFVWVWAGSPGVLWSDFMFSWAKGPNNKNYVGVDYTFLSKTYEIDDFHGIAVDFGVTNLPMTLWAQLTYSVNPLIPMKETGCPIFPRLDNGFYVLLPDLPFKPQSENFDSAGWPKSLDPHDQIVDDFAWRMRGRGKIKGEKAEGDSGRSYHEVRVPSSFIFNTPELRSLLSDEEKQRLQQFIDSTKPKHPVPPNIVVIDGDCPESLPYTIGGGCRCKDAVFGCPWTPNSYLLNGRWSCSDLPVGGALRIEVERQKPMSICSDTFRSPRVIGMDGVMALGVKATCTEGTLIGGSCAYKSSYSNLGWLASFPVDASTFMCLGRGDTGQSPEIEVTALAYCLELWAIQNVITVQRYGLDTASAKCPDGYRVVGGGCSYEDGNDFHLDQSYPTTQNTWECVFSSTDSCGEGSPHCLLSVAYALCLGN
eukprot:symbB.v1.2.014887.t1/scaffold1099.1/size138014/3